MRLGRLRFSHVRRVAVGLLFVGMVGCGADASNAPPACDRGLELDGVPIPKCLLDRGTISPATYASAQVVLQQAVAFRDSLRPLHSSYAGYFAPYITRPIQQLDDFYDRGILDSTLFNRTIDRIAITLDYARGKVYDNGYVKFPARTPGLVWLEPESSGGLFFQPVTTLLQTGVYYDGSWLPLDSVTRVAESFWRYAHWVDGTGVSAGLRFPIWQYNFYWNGGGIPVMAPWKSGLAQGMALEVFAKLYTRTKDTLWLARARQTAVSMKVPWTEGGVLLADATEAWWEEYYPLTRIWNGNAFALLGVGEYLKVVPDDAALSALYRQGLQTTKAVARAYDSGQWLAYSRTQDRIIAPYQGVYVGLAQRLAAQTGDPDWAEMATRWASYVYPGPSAVPSGASPVQPAPLLVPSDLHAVLYYGPHMANKIQ